MKMTIESTGHIYKINGNNGVKARLWKGTTEGGAKVMCFITRIALDKDEPAIEEFLNDFMIQDEPYIFENNGQLNIIL
jgi:hypothetical protein